MNVIVTTDGSASSLQAIPHAAAIARATGAGLVLMRVLDARLDVGGVLATRLEEAVATTTARWQEELEAALAEAGVEGAALVARKGRDEEARATILRTAAEQDAALIAMATRGAGWLRRALLGSVTLGVIGAGDLPVIVAGTAIAPPPASTPYRLVVTTDGSGASRVVTRALARLLTGSEVEVTLLRLVWPGAAEGREAAEADLREVRAALPAELRVTELVRETPMVDGVATAIVEVAQELGAAAIAMATHGHGGARHLFAGSVAMGVLGQSPLPVILADAHKSRF
jgi:nucleotide-binding universal stress UspA family protein